MTTRVERSRCIRLDEPVPSGARMWLADVIEYHYRGYVLGRTPFARFYRRVLERTLGPVWRWLAQEPA